MPTGNFWDLSNPQKPKGLKDPQAVLDIPFDWTDWLTNAGGRTLASYSFTAPGATVVAISRAGNVCTGIISGGVVGTVVPVTCHIVTSGSPPLEDDRTVYLKIVQR